MTDYTGPERRRSVLTGADHQEIALRAIDAVGLKPYHLQWIDAEIEKQRERAQFWRGMKSHVAKWGAVSILSLLGYLLWQGFKHYVR